MIETSITLRLPRVLKQAVAQAAKNNRRSMNSEILARLESAFPSGVDQTHAHLMPCLCGGGRPCETWSSNGRDEIHHVQCSCGRGTSGESSDAAALRWNAIVRGTVRAA